MALYFSALVMIGFNSGRKLFKAKIITVKLKAVLLLNVSLCICPLTFINKTLHFPSIPFVASTASP